MTWTFAISLLAALALLGFPCLADTVRVRATAAVPAGAPVLVADIADIEGESVAATGAVVVLDAAAATKRRRARAEAGRGLSMTSASGAGIEFKAGDSFMGVGDCVRAVQRGR